MGDETEAQGSQVTRLRPQSYVMGPPADPGLWGPVPFPGGSGPPAPLMAAAWTHALSPTSTRGLLQLLLLSLSIPPTPPSFAHPLLPNPQLQPPVFTPFTRDTQRARSEFADAASGQSLTAAKAFHPCLSFSTDDPVPGTGHRVLPAVSRAADRRLL